MPNLQKRLPAQSGFAPVLLLIVVALVLVGTFVFLKTKKGDPMIPLKRNPNSVSMSQESTIDNAPLVSSNNVSWTFDGKSWQASNTPPECMDPLVFPAPVDVNLVSGILYPGQIRGNDFKAHGGFRFDNRNTNDIEVRAIMDGSLYKASRYLVGKEEQFFVFYINDCGIMVMHDHLLALSPKLEEALSKLPLNPENDSRTTLIEPGIPIAKGEILATEIGLEDFEGRKNIFVDFGLYDLRKVNGVKSDGEYAPYALCWLDYLESEDAVAVRQLPAGGLEGKVSDYCNTL